MPLMRVSVLAVAMLGCSSEVDNSSSKVGALCGDGHVTADEECDDMGASHLCDADCTTPVCGDGTVNIFVGEKCDDGNTDDCAGTCSADCSTPVTGCGDGIVCGTEQCDDLWESASCDSDCTVVACGDGKLNATAGERCDDGNTDDCVGDCSSDCSTLLYVYGCGDGIVCGTEQCDDQGESANCNVDCTTVACGDGKLNTTAGETCDDGGTADGDGCTASCLYEPRGGWISLPGGSYMMGSTTGDADEQPVHEVTVSAFQMMTTEVTVADYQNCVDAGNCTASGEGWNRNSDIAGREDHPVNYVDWDQARAYCAWIGGRLPSESEWEYAARSGGQGITYPWGEETPTCDYAVMDDGVGSDVRYGCSEWSTWPVCSKVAGNSAGGLCDMAGNVWEWVQDWYHDSYDGAPVDGGAWEAGGKPYRVLRGGGWMHRALAMRAVYRGYAEPGAEISTAGFRCVRPRS